MRPAQLRRFGSTITILKSFQAESFNEAGAAAPVWQLDDRQSPLPETGFNEAGAAAPVWPNEYSSEVRVIVQASMRPAQLRRFGFDRRSLDRSVFSMLQ